MPEELGRYEILAEIGQGGFATVYRARDTQLGRLVALKELKPALLQDTNWIRRFRREARTIARLDHPRIVAIYDIHEAGQRLFIVMRLVDGPSYEQVLAARGPLAWAETVETMAAIAEGLDYAHTQNFLHRDLKPANILQDPERGPMLTDFGLAKLVGEHSTSLTASGGFVGTPHYLAPEVWEGQGSRAQSDIYALGCVLYELLTGSKLYRGETPPAVMMSHFKPITLASVWPEDVPPGVEEALATAVAKNPDDRYATAGEFVAALVELTQAGAETGTGPPQPDVATEPKGEVRRDPAIPVNGPERATTRTAWSPSDEISTFAVSATGVEDESSLGPSSSGKWRGFLAHLGPYLIVITMLAVLNQLTDPGGYPWFIWPALGWGVGLAFHFHGILISELKVSSHWRSFWGHFGSYAIIIGLLLAIYLMTDPGGYPWFLWPAGIWGAIVFSHLWGTMVGVGGRRGAKTTRRHTGRRAERTQRRARRRPAKPRQAEGEISDPVIQAHLDKAHTYQDQIEALIAATSDRNTHVRLQELATHLGEWTQAIEDLARRIDRFQRNTVIQHDLETVPQAIEKLEAQLSTEADAATRAELERTLANRKKQLASLEHLQSMMKRAEIKIESTLSALGTMYSHILASKSTNYVADYGRLSAEVDEEVRVLQDHLEALEEVKLSGG